MLIINFNVNNNMKKLIFIFLIINCIYFLYIIKYLFIYFFFILVFHYKYLKKRTVKQ